MGAANPVGFDIFAFAVEERMATAAVIYSCARSASGHQRLPHRRRNCHEKTGRWPEEFVQRCWPRAQLLRIDIHQMPEDRAVRRKF